MNALTGKRFSDFLPSTRASERRDYQSLLIQKSGAVEGVDRDR